MAGSVWIVTIFCLSYLLLMLATIVEGDQKAPFYIANTLRCREGCYSFLWIAPLHPWYVSYIALPTRLMSRLIVWVGRVFANGPGDLGSIPDHVIPKTLKMGLDTSFLNTQQYKVCIKGKVEQSRERSSAFPYTSM